MLLMNWLKKENVRKMMNKKTHRGIIAIELYKLTLEDIVKLKSPGGRGIPEYCLQDNGYIIDAHYFNQFIDVDSVNAFSEKEDRYFFNLFAMDNLIHNEMNDCGVDSFFNKIDMIPVFKNLTTMKIDNNTFYIPTSQYIVIELEYKSYGYPDYDYDMDVNIIGYLDKNLNLCQIEA